MDAFKLVEKGFYVHPIRKLLLLIAFLSILTETCTAKPALLPSSLYFLDGASGGAQVWRLERDGVTRQQVTFEEAGVDDFSVSSVNGDLAFVSANRLFLVKADGEARRLIADGNTVDPMTEDYGFRGIVSDPSFSPDGKTLAYAFNGLHLYDTATGQDQHVLTNLGNLLGESFVFALEAYYPGAWSPDGKHLLVVMGYYEGSTLAVMEPGAAQPFTRLRSEGPACCLFSWSGDSQSVLVANPYFTTDLPGFWRYDVETGEQIVVVPGLTQEGTLNYSGWPLQLPSGDFLFFYVNLERFSPDVGIPLAMVQSAADGSSITPVRTDVLHIIDALWEPDGSATIIVGRHDKEDWHLWLARLDGSPLQVLIEDAQQIRDLTWGP
jgi:WD40 repeat protein